MQKISLICILLLLGCVNLQFDPAEYSQFIDIKYLADDRINICQNKENVNKAKLTLKEIIDKQTIYAQYRSERTLIYSSTKKLQDLIIEFNSKQNMSKVYCIAKLENISVGALLIIQSLGAM